MDSMRHVPVIVEDSVGERGISSRLASETISARTDPVLLQRYVELAPDILLPKQFDDMMRRPRLRNGEIRLMFAVLEDAIQCYLTNMNPKTERQRRDFTEVEEWFTTPGTSNRGWQNLFAFEPLCESLGIEPKRLRSELFGMQHSNRVPKRMRRAHRAPGGLVQPRLTAAIAHARA